MPGNLRNCQLALSLYLSLIHSLPIYQRSLPFLCFRARTTHMLGYATHWQPKNHMSHLTAKTAQLITNQCNTSVENVNKPAKTHSSSWTGAFCRRNQSNGNKMESFNDSHNSNRNNNNNNRPRIKCLFVVVCGCCSC